MAKTTRIERILAANMWREAAIARQLAAHLPAGATVLDLGAGSCKLTQYLQSRHHVAVTPVDVVDHNVTDLPLQLYDGATLPFADNSFDVVLVVFVLHHAVGMSQVLHEARRVARNAVIVIEDAPRNRFETYAWRTLDYLLNHAAHHDIHVAHTARSVADWRDLFAQADLHVQHVQTFRTFAPVMGLYRHATFVLDV